VTSDYSLKMGGHNLKGEKERHTIGGIPRKSENPCMVQGTKKSEASIRRQSCRIGKQESLLKKKDLKEHDMELHENGLGSAHGNAYSGTDGIRRAVSHLEKTKL